MPFLLLLFQLLQQGSGEGDETPKKGGGKGKKGAKSRAQKGAVISGSKKNISNKVGLGPN